MNTETQKNETENITATDWNKEVEQLEMNAESQGAWFNPKKSGAYNFKIIRETGKYFGTFKDQTVEKLGLEIQLKDSTDILKWSVTKGLTKTSLYGQLAVLGKKHGSLNGITITLIVMFEKDKAGAEKRKYTIVEASELV